MLEREIVVYVTLLLASLPRKPFCPNTLSKLGVNSTNAISKL